ncbi:MAG TPA: class F sortase [Patescibacteria group bacterium]|nr:class F sortase [Patescibacteria group bacterium]
MDTPNVSLKRILTTILITEALLSASLIAYFIVHRPPRSASASVRTPHSIQKEVKLPTATIGFPVRFRIPQININTTFDYVRLTDKGALEAPKGPTNVGWFDHGPRPGEKGSAVIDGHFGYRDNIPAVFDNLHTLQPGDLLYVEDERGATITFIVSAVRTYSENDNATDVFRSSDGKAHLNLITCGGTWSQAKKSYSNRLVVFTDKK